MLAIISLTTLGLGLGFALGLASRLLRVEQADGLAAEIEAMLPGSQCGQCGFPGCAQAAAALLEGKAQVTLCPPGGRELARKLAARLGVEADLSAVQDGMPMLATVNESLCIGCTKCFRVCPTDAVVGAPKQIHSILREACTGCGKCVDVCPTMAVGLEPLPQTLHSWTWYKPMAA